MKRLGLYLILMGLIEIFVITLLASNILGLIIGLITIIPASIALNEKRIKWNTVLGILGIIKYNPLIWIGLIGFIFGDLHAAGEKGLKLDFKYTLIVVAEFSFVILVATSFIISIVLLNKTIKKIKSSQIPKMEEL